MLGCDMLLGLKGQRSRSHYYYYYY